MFLLPFFDKIPRNQGELADEMKPAANTDEMGRAFKYIEEAWNPKGIEGNAHKLQKDAANVSVDFGLVAHIMEIMRRAAPSIVTQKGTLNNRGRFLSSVLDRVVTERDPLVHFTVELLVTEPSFVQFCLDIEPWKTLIHKHVDSHTGLLGALADWWETQDGMSVTSAQLRLANLALVEAVKATDDLVRADLNRLERAVEGKLGKINSQQWAEFLDWLSSEFQHYEASGLLRLSRRVSVFRSLLGAFSRPDSQRKEAVEKLLDDPLMAFTEEDKERIRAGNA
jgi:hypothetical protein